MFYVGGNTERSLLEMNPFGGMQTISGVFFGLILYAVIFLLTKLFEIGKVLRRALEDYKWRSFLLAITEVILLDFATNLGTDRIKYRDVRIVITSVTVVVIVTCLLLVLLLKKTLETEQQLLSIRNQIIECQYAELRNAYEENRCLIHDERYRMQYLMECMENNEYGKARIFLEEKEYLLLAPADDTESEDVFVFRVDEVDGKKELNLVEDDREFLAVKKEYKKLLY